MQNKNILRIWERNLLVHSLVKGYIGKFLIHFYIIVRIQEFPPLFVHDKFITNCKEKASIFNTFSSSKCTPLSNDGELPALRFRTNSRISSFEKTFNEISDMIAGLGTKKAHGPDNISVNMLKLCGEHLCVPLQNIFGNILETGIIPDQWKEANVTPGHKKTDKQIITNLRPISLLPILTKVFEKTVFKNLFNYLVDNNFISFFFFLYKKLLQTYKHQILYKKIMK